MVKQNIEHHDTMDEIDNIPRSSYSVTVSYKTIDPGEAEKTVVTRAKATITILDSADYEVEFLDKMIFHGRIIKGNLGTRCVLDEIDVKGQKYFELTTNLDNYIIDGSVSILYIYFDDNSSSVYSNFKERYKYVRYLEYKCLKYDNGKVQFYGYFNRKKDKLTGTGIELHYNGVDGNKAKKEKYKGNFEDGDYSGGTFTSWCGNIKVYAPNICNGKPNGLGQLRVGSNYKQDFKWKDLEKHNITLSAFDMCDTLLKFLHDDSEALLCKISFDRLTLSQKADRLYSMNIQSEEDIFYHAQYIKNRFNDIWFYVNLLMIAVYTIIIPLTILLMSRGDFVCVFTLPLAAMVAYMSIMGMFKIFLKPDKGYKKIRDISH